MNNVTIVTKVLHTRCFPHVVNLACQAILSAITQMDYADEDLVDFDPETAGVNRDVIAMIRSLVRSVCFFYITCFRYLTWLPLDKGFITPSTTFCIGSQNVEARQSPAVA
jgi:hypothetical protein